MPVLAIAHLLADSDSNSGDVIIACLFLIGIVIAASIGVMWVRRWAKAPEEIPSGGFTLGALRDLQRSGKITAEEFERTKAMIVAATKKASEKKNVPVPKRDLN